MAHHLPYYGANVVIGIALAVQGYPIEGAWSLPTALMALGGTAMALSSVYEAYRTTPEEFSVPAWTRLLMLGAAALAVLGTVLSF